MTRCVILGAGRVGRAIAHDLSASDGWEVTVADRSPASLAALAGLSVATESVDLADPAVVARLAAAHEIAIGALPSFLGFGALAAVVATGTPYVDISFFAEDPFTLDAAARDAGAVAVVDCGIAPGCDNLILGHWVAEMDAVERFVCYVGGLPTRRSWPWEYKAPFAPYDVLAEYTRPARYVAAGRLVVRPALSEPELVDFAEIGTLEAFNTDGLRTLLTTVDVPDRREMTLRYPGHAEKIRLLRSSGFLSPEPIEVDGVEVSPLAVTSRLLFDRWRLDPDEEDLTVFRVELEGRRDGRRERHRYDLLDRRDPATGLSSMARTTGFTCAAIARRVAEGSFRRPGISAAEHVGMERSCFAAVVDDLAARGVRLVHSSETLPQ